MSGASPTAALKQLAQNFEAHTHDAPHWFYAPASQPLTPALRQALHWPAAARAFVKLVRATPLAQRPALAVYVAGQVPEAHALTKAAGRCFKLSLASMPWSESYGQLCQLYRKLGVAHPLRAAGIAQAIRLAHTAQDVAQLSNAHGLHDHMVRQL